MMDKSELSKARRAQEHFAARYGTVSGVQGIGLGLTADRSAAVIEVLIDQAGCAEPLPESFEGVPVRAKAVGKIRAF